MSQPFWVFNGGSTHNSTAKLWNPASFQNVIDHFKDKIAFVQIGADCDFHPEYQNVVNLVGKTSQRDLIRLMFHGLGILTPVSFPMHLAAAMPERIDRPGGKPCVVLAGGREPLPWERYAGHSFIETQDKLDCCRRGDCRRSLASVPERRAVHYVCVRPVQLSIERWSVDAQKRKVRATNLCIAECMEMITPDMVIREIESWIKAYQPEAERTIIERRPVIEIPDSHDGRIAVAVGGYGDYPEYTLRCLDSIAPNLTTIPTF